MKPAVAEASKEAAPPSFVYPAAASTKQTTRVGGKAVSYTATAGALPVRDPKNKTIAQVVYTAYTLDGPRDPNRPVTFAFNGGPGAASVFLHMGAIGPKRVQFGAQGDAPSDSAVLKDNPYTWLDFTDLVFIDPVNTGFSRSLVDEAETKKAFYGVEQDISYLSRIIYDWLVKNERLTSPKYIAGESYGGFRAPRLAHKLQSELGVGVSGLVIISPLFDGSSWVGGDYSPMQWVVTLPTMAAANYERQGKALTAAQMGEVEAYARGEFAADLLKGWSDPAALDRIVTKVTHYTGLPQDKVREWGGRVETRAILRELYRKEGRVGSWYEANVTLPDAFPWAPDQRMGDPLLEGLVAPTTSAYVDLVTRQIGWKVDDRYYALNLNVITNWDIPNSRVESVGAFRRALANDPKMKVLVVHGYGDLATPYMSSKIIIDQVPPNVAGDRLALKVYAGGHMFYSRADSGAAMRSDVMALYGAR
ncbi:peptidase S10 [Caulobacter segnis]|uniref:S10 family peptidase n=1 Tax=Caulobacter segnis TaxID=88688 RepID=UPI0024106B5B|nr:peptidase S10 [Caulobacter segnis]MDG2521933.1 peptidase S10 [Caulobacter segnis]